MSANALESQGMSLKISNGASPEVFTAIADISDISGPDGSASEIDTTTLDDSARTFRVGLKDEGQISFTCNFQPANTQHAQLKTDRTNRTLRNFKLLFTDSPVTTWSFAAYVMGISIANGVDGVTTASVTLRISGVIT